MALFDNYHHKMILGCVCVCFVRLLTLTGSSNFKNNMCVNMTLVHTMCDVGKHMKREKIKYRLEGTTNTTTVSPSNSRWIGMKLPACLDKY